MKTLLSIPVIGRIILFFYRFKIQLGYTFPRRMQAWAWLFKSKETTNFTYELDALSRAYLVDFVAFATKKSCADIEGYIQELEQDADLKKHILSHTAKHPERYKADMNVFYARRLGWYAMVRALRPKVVIETGIDKGLGSCVLCSALLRNEKEGFLGHYYGTDINPKAGYLLQPPYNAFGTILFGDSITSLKAFEHKIDLFINDSDHSADYEAREYETILPKLSEQGFIISDNAELTDKLRVFSHLHGRPFLFYKEMPQHWFAGGGIGLSFPK
jgi:predicted O-methyltransferase YrrM